MVLCPYCGREFPGDKLNARHLSICNPSPKAEVLPCLCGHESTSLTQMKRHRRTCAVWKNRDKQAVQQARTRAAFEEKYGEGVTNARHVPEAEERRKETVLERYGAENVFAKRSSIFDGVQASMDGKRPVLKGADNPFAKPEVQEKIRQHWQREHGVENPQQVPEIRARTRATNIERYGGELLGSPELAAKVRATNEERYGDAFPQRTDGVKARQQETNLERYGVPWTAMDPEVRAKQLVTMEANYGSHFFASDEGKKTIRAAMREKYGVEYWMQREGAWDELVQTFRERLGVDHPLQLIEYLEKRGATNIERYGVEHVLQNLEVMARLIATCQDRYSSDYYFGSEDHLDRRGEFLAKTRESNIKRWGVPHPMMNREYARKHLEKMGASAPGPNGLERRVLAAAPEGTLMYTGDRSWWRWLPKLGHHKNPDFILPGPDPAKPKKGVTKVVEAFGDFWHSRMFTGKAPFEHESELIAAFADIGIECLVVWESEVKADPDEVGERVRAFLG